MHRQPAIRIYGLASLLEALSVLIREVPSPIWTISSMLISIAVYSFHLGWKLSTGFMILLLIHEFGHLLAASWYGTPITAPVFIPYIGAIIGMKKSMRNAWEESVFGISGPILGSLGAFACLGIQQFTGSYYFGELALFGFFLNLFNLIPLADLDGGHVVTALTRWFWLPGYLLMAAFAWYTHAAVPIIALIVFFPSVLSLFRGKVPKHISPDYYSISRFKRISMGVLYLSLVIILLISFVFSIATLKGKL